MTLASESTSRNGCRRLNLELANLQKRLILTYLNGLPLQTIAQSFVPVDQFFAEAVLALEQPCVCTFQHFLDAAQLTCIDQGEALELPENNRPCRRPYCVIVRLAIPFALF